MYFQFILKRINLILIYNGVILKPAKNKKIRIRHGINSL